jgi:hypothetical protein
LGRAATANARAFWRQLKMTQLEVWTDYGGVIRRLVEDARRQNRVLMASVVVPGGTLIITANLGPRFSGEPAGAPYLVEWVGPWDSHGRFLVDSNLDLAVSIRARAA